MFKTVAGQFLYVLFITSETLKLIHLGYLMHKSMRIKERLVSKIDLCLSNGYFVDMLIFFSCHGLIASFMFFKDILSYFSMNIQTENGLIIVTFSEFLLPESLHRPQKESKLRCNMELSRCRLSLHWLLRLQNQSVQYDGMCVTLRAQLHLCVIRVGRVTNVM